MKNFSLFVVIILILSIIFTLIDIYPNYNSAYDLGYSSGVMFKNMLKTSFTLALFFFAYNKFKKVKA